MLSHECQGRRENVPAGCRWSTIMSVVNRSGKMSVHERIDIDPDSRTAPKAPSAQRVILEGQISVEGRGGRGSAGVSERHVWAESWRSIGRRVPPHWSRPHGNRSSRRANNSMHPEEARTQVVALARTDGDARVNHTHLTERILAEREEIVLGRSTSVGPGVSLTRRRPAGSG